MTDRVVMFSGGIGSWATARRVAARHGHDDMTLLFADTRVEDADTYRFLTDAAANIGAELVRVADGRTPFEVFHDDHFLGNQRLANCSKYLKQIPCREWLDANRDPRDTVLYVGIDWTETHRIPAIQAGWSPWRVETPMAERPWIDKDGMLATAHAEGLKPPSAYDAGFPHANCLDQGCVRGGQAYWREVLIQRPEVYERTEAAEQRVRETEWGADAAMLRDRTGGETTPITLRELRERVETQPTLVDLNEWGACACFTEEVPA